MTEATSIRELETQLSELKNKKSQLDAEVIRHEINQKNAKESLEKSLNELKDMGFSSIQEAEEYLDKSVKDLKNLLTEAQNKIDGIVTE